MDIFRINERMEQLANNLEQAHPKLTDFIWPVFRLILLILPILTAALYSKIYQLGWSLVERFELIVPGSESAYSLVYVLLVIPVICLFSVPLILPSCWAIRTIELTERKSVVDLILSLIILIFLGWIVPLANNEMLKTLPSITADRATLLSVTCYSSITLTLALCHWPSHLRIYQPRSESLHH